LAPRGEFSKGAIALKEKKKRLYIGIAKIVGLYKSIVWQASSEKEARDIRREFESEEQIVVTPNVPSNSPEIERENSKIKGNLDVLYLSRITPKKNLTYVLNMLKQVNRSINLNIYGPINDIEYWNRCISKVNSLPKVINVNYGGSVSHNKVTDIMSNNDLFFLPTHGENFGHVILEALSAGCPVLISDQTPWQGLEDKGVGYDVPLDRPEKFCRILQRFVDMEESTHQKWRRRAREFGKAHQKDQETVEKNIQLFQQVLKIR
jgi:glycosyltransferase involved in cell wall biosynthesis